MVGTAPSTDMSPADVRRTQILEAAAAVFARKGYQRATVKEVAAQAGVAPGTIYLYFENKRDLLMAIADHLIGQSWAQTSAQMAQIEPETYVAAVLRNTLDFFHQHKALVQALITEIWTDPQLQEQFFDRVLQPIFVGGVGYLQAQIAQGRARPCRAEIVIPTVAGSLVVLSVLRALAHDHFLAEFSDDELTDELTRLYFYGLQAHEGVVSP